MHDPINLIDVLDDSGLRQGSSTSKSRIHALGMVHRAVHLYLFDYQNNLLLQQRSDHVDQYPGKLSISLTGHIDAGEYSSQALKREIQEELGFNSNNMNLEFLFSYRQDVQINHSCIDRQFNDVYACWYDFEISNIVFHSQDICALKLVSIPEFKHMMVDPDCRLIPVSFKECTDVFYFLKDRLETIKSS